MKPEQEGMLAGKEFPWQAVKGAREKELQYWRELGVYEKVDERAAVAKYSVTPLDTKWVDTDKAFEGRCKSVQFKNGERTDLYAGTLPLEALKAIISIAASHSPVFSLMHVDVSRAHFHRKNRAVEEEHVRYQRCSKQLGTSLARASRKNWGYELGRSSRNLFHNKKKKTSGLTRVYPIKASIIGAGSTKSIKALS